MHIQSSVYLCILKKTQKMYTVLELGLNATKRINSGQEWKWNRRARHIHILDELGSIDIRLRQKENTLHFISLVESKFIFIICVIRTQSMCTLLYSFIHFVFVFSPPLRPTVNFDHYGIVVCAKWIFPA